MYYGLKLAFYYHSKLALFVTRERYNLFFTTLFCTDLINLAYLSNAIAVFNQGLPVALQQKVVKDGLVSYGHIFSLSVARNSSYEVLTNPLQVFA